MKTTILTSSLDFYDKDEFGNRTPHQFPNLNGVVDMIKSTVKNYNNFLFVASNETAYELTDLYANCTFKSFDLTLPFKKYSILDGRTKNKAKELINNADFIFLCGGHVPTQNAFFNNINLKKLLKNYNGVICGGSAGSMNCANVVYCPPELDGEALDPNFKRYYDGLGLTDINVMPHFQDMKDVILDGMQYLTDILLPDSHKTKMIAINDGSYIVCSNGKETLYGEAYLLSNGKVELICENNKKLDITGRNSQKHREK